MIGNPKRHRCADCGMLSASAVRVVAAAHDGPYSDYAWFCRNVKACAKRMRARGIELRAVVVNPPRKRKAA